MKSASFRFYAELNDFLPRCQRGEQVSYGFRGAPAVKDAIEAIGVPHGEVDLIMLDGRSVDFYRPLHDGAYVSVFPVFESIDISSLSRLRPKPLRESRFVLDAHLGKLAQYLRMLGFDSLWANDFGDAELARRSSEGWILLTRDRGLLKRNAVTHGYWVRNTEPQRQCAEVVQRFELHGQLRPFTRCLRCNALLREAERASVQEDVPANVWREHAEFRRCPRCGRVYWRGSHHRRMTHMLEQITQAPEQNWV